VLWWAFAEPERLSAEVADLLTRPELVFHFSSLSLSELSVQRAKGRLKFGDEVLMEGIQKLGFRELVLRSAHALRAGALPPHHRDPFDRLIIAQAAVEGLIMVSADSVFPMYGVPLIRA
jgi:PIN domain nuclease of toxin-antitoxin system